MTHTKQPLLVTVCDTTTVNGASFRTHARTHAHTDGWTEEEEGQTDVEVEIVI